MDLQAKKKDKDRKSTGTRHKNKRGDSKVESNDSPEILDMGETSDVPASLRGVFGCKRPVNRMGSPENE